MDIRVGLHLGFVTAVASVLVAWNQVSVPKVVRLDADGAATAYQTRQVQVAGFLRETGVNLVPGDRVYPPVNAGIGPGGAVRVVRSFPVTLVVNGAVRQVRTTADTLRGVLDEQGLLAGPSDKLALQGRPVPVDAPIAENSLIEVQQARSLFVHDAGNVLEVPSYAPTVGQALFQAGVGLKPGDDASPSADRVLTPGLHVYMDRAKDVTVNADGLERPVRTRVATVRDLLAQAGIAVSTADRVAPSLADPVAAGLRVMVTRVREERQVIDETLTYETRYLPDPEVEIGQQWVDEPGVSGLYRREFTVRFENGEEVDRVIAKEGLEWPAQTKVVRYGTKIVPYYVDTGSGLVQYWQVMRVWATWYNPRSAGRPAWSPSYGITSIGVRVHRGIIAVDPRVIPYYTQMYVPGYGVGIAADTGGGIKGNHIDLGFADDEPSNWGSRWVDIYLLGNPPPVRPPG